METVLYGSAAGGLSDHCSMLQHSHSEPFAEWLKMVHLPIAASDFADRRDRKETTMSCVIVRTTRRPDGIFFTLLFGLAATTMLGGCPSANPVDDDNSGDGGWVTTPAGNSGSGSSGGGAGTNGGGPTGGGSGTTGGGGGTPSGGTTPPQPPTLSEGVHHATLQAAEAKRFRLPMSSGETAIVNANVPNEATDVDVLVYSPHGAAAITSSTNNAGMPDHVRFSAGESGDYSFEIVNIGDSHHATCTLNLQRIPSPTAAADSLHGVYALAEVNGQSLSGPTRESWVFNNGRLTSFFGVFGAADFGLPEELPYWVDATSGASMDVPFTGRTVSIAVRSSDVTAFADGQTAITFSARITRTEPGVPTIIIDQQYDFAGVLTDDGCALCGDVENAVYLEGDSVLEIQATARLEKCPSSERCDSGGQCNVPSPNAGFVGVAAGVGHSLGLKADGSIVAWGENLFGQLNVPSPNANFVAVAAGEGHSMGLTADGSIRAWGVNSDGQCCVPSPNAGFTTVAAGNRHSLGLKADGSIRAWGRNGHGQCTVPSPNAGFVAIAAGQYHSLALRFDGSIVVWGGSHYDQTTVPSPNSPLKYSVFSRTKGFWLYPPTKSAPVS